MKRNQEAVAMSSIRVYNILKEKFSDEEAQYIANAIEQKDDVATKTDLLNQKIELKQGINDLKVELKEDIKNLMLAISSMKLQTYLLWLATIIVVVSTNPKALDLITKLTGVAK